MSEEKLDAYEPSPAAMRAVVKVLKSRSYSYTTMRGFWTSLARDALTAAWKADGAGGHPLTW